MSIAPISRWTPRDLVGSNTGSGVGRFFTMIGGSARKPKSCFDRSWVASSHSTDVFSLHPISRADMLTSLPYKVYSARSSVPTVPQKTLPLVTPTRISWPIAWRSPSQCTASWIPRSASLSWWNGLGPKHAKKTAPLSSMLKRQSSAWKRWIPRTTHWNTFCPSCATSWRV